MRSSLLKVGSGFLSYEPFGRSGNVSTLASLIRDTRASSQGKLLHNCLLQYGHLHDTFLKNCLIEMYSNCGSVADARSVFDNIKNPNLFSFNLMMRTYAMSGNAYDAQDLFNHVPKPDAYTWNLLLKAFIKSGALEDARKAFECMPSQTVVSWTAMIAALAHDGHCQEALELFYRMHTQSPNVDRVIFLRVLDACSSYPALTQGQEIHAAIIEHGLIDDHLIGTSLISMYGKCESLTHAKAVFLRTENKDIVCWTSLITACAQNQHYEEALCFFFEIQSQGIAPDSFTYASVLDACSGLLLLQEGRQLHAVILEGGFEQQFMMGTALINLYGKCHNLQDAKCVFYSQTKRDVVAWNALISAMVESDCNLEALRLFWQMHLHAIKADSVTYLCTLNACINLVAVEEGQEVQMAMAEFSVTGNVMLTTSLINLYGKARRLSDAKHLFHSMACCGVISWNVLISAHVSNGLAKEALILILDMRQAGLEANSVTFMYAVDACSLLADLEAGWEIHGDLVENGCEDDPLVCLALLKMYGKCKSPHDTVYIFKNLKEVDLVSWTALIGSHIENGSCEAALSAFCQMQLKGVEPDGMAYVCALDACASLAALDKGVEIHHDIQAKGFQKEMMVANALIHMYGNCGDIGKTQYIFRSLPQPNLATWNAVLAAFAHNGQGNEVLGVFSNMLDNSVQPDGITFVAILTVCSHAGWIDDGRYYFTGMRSKFKISHAEEHYVCMIDSLGRAGQLEEAEQILPHFSIEKIEMAWLSLLGASRIHNDHQRALRAIEKLSGFNHGIIGPSIVVG